MRAGKGAARYCVYSSSPRPRLDGGVYNGRVLRERVPAKWINRTFASGGIQFQRSSDLSNVLPHRALSQPAAAAEGPSYCSDRQP